MILIENEYETENNRWKRNNKFCPLGILLEDCNCIMFDTVYCSHHLFPQSEGRIQSANNYKIEDNFLVRKIE